VHFPATSGEIGAIIPLRIVGAHQNSLAGEPVDSNSVEMRTA